MEPGRPLPGTRFIPLSAATSRAPTVRRNPSLRNGGAGWPTSPGRNLQLPSPAMRPCPTCLAASAPMPASTMSATPPTPARQKFYGDINQKLTDTHHPPDLLRARAQPHRRRPPRTGAEGAGARPLPALARGPAEGEAAPARRPHRAAVPREVAHRLERLEPAVRRDHGGAQIRGRGARSWPSSRPSTCSQAATRRSARQAAEAIAKTLQATISASSP